MCASSINLEEELLKEHSRVQAQKIVNFILQNPQAFPELMNIFFCGEYRLVQRASWPVSLLAQEQPHLFDGYMEKIILNLKNPVPDAVKRNSTKVLMLLQIPEDLVGVTVDIMFNFLLDKKEPVAVKANAISIIFQLCKNEPEIIKELRIIIEDQLPYSTPAFSSRAKKILNK